MIRLIIFDLDGVLVETKDIHFRALNAALAEVNDRYVISEADHTARFDGKPTKTKLDMLTRERGLPPTEHDGIYQRKQTLTLAMLESDIAFDPAIYSLFEWLRESKREVHVASNAVRRTVEVVLRRLKIDQFVHAVISNEDVTQPKPAAEMYLRCMIGAGVGPRETLIVEDSYVGREAVYNAGAHLCPVNRPSDLTKELIMHAIDKAGGRRRMWKDEKMDVLIPMAGAGKRFAQAGYTFPKPLIDIGGKPMIQVVVENLAIDARHIYIVQREHCAKYSLDALLRAITPNCVIVPIDGVTEGAACTTLLAKGYIGGDRQLVLANSDQWMGGDWDSSAWLYAMQASGIDGSILTFENVHPKWSYADVDPSGWIRLVAEKRPISNRATVGVYYWRRGADYVKYADAMIAANDRTNGEFYVCPVYNHAIKAGKRVKEWQVSEMWGLGTPEDLSAYMRGRHGR